MNMKYCMRNMKCPSDMKLLRNEVKLIPSCASRALHSVSYFIRFSVLLKSRKGFISWKKTACNASGLFLVRVPRFELGAS